MSILSQLGTFPVPRGLDMYANASETGSVASLTTELVNDCGSEMLRIRLPFEARMYEFSLPAPEALDASEEDEVPVLRRCVDTHTGEVIRVRSLPTVIKEVCIARYGGVRDRTRWFSARATLSASEVGSPVAPEGPGVAEHRIMTDGGEEFEVTEEKYGSLSAACPRCGFEFWRSANPEKAEEPEHHGEAGLRSAVNSHLEHCGEFEPIKVRATGYVFDRINGYNADFQGTRSYRFNDAMRRQKTNIVIITPEEAAAVASELTCYDSSQRSWMNGMQDKALRRVRNEIREAMKERGFEVVRDPFGSVAGFERESDSDRSAGASEESGSGSEPETDGGEESEVMTDGGEERLPRRCPNDDTILEPKDGKPLTNQCPECGYTIPRNLKGETVKVCHKKARIVENSRSEGEAYRAEIELGGIVQNVFISREEVREAVAPDEPEVMTDGGTDIRQCPRCERVNNLFVNPSKCYNCSYRWGEDGEVLNDGGEALDDGAEILTDGGRPVREADEHRTLMKEYNPDTWDPEPDPDYYKSGSVSIHDPIEGEAYSEPGHWADRPADMDADHARRLALRGEFDDLDEHQPLPLISSNMRGVPTEGVQGTYSEVVELDEPCPECSQCWGIGSTVTMAGVHRLVCLTCDNVISRG